MRFSFKVASTALSLAATVLLSWLVTGSRLLEIAGEKGSRPEQLTQPFIEKQQKQGMNVVPISPM